jgi:Flp pilus assembly pilin Flp
MPADDRSKDNRENSMNLTKAFVRVREAVIRIVKAQTMTEYTLVLVAIAIATFGAYLVLGNSVISSLTSGADSELTSA